MKVTADVSVSLPKLCKKKIVFLREAIPKDTLKIRELRRIKRTINNKTRRLFSSLAHVKGAANRCPSKKIVFWY